MQWPITLDLPPEDTLDWPEAAAETSEYASEPERDRELIEQLSDPAPQPEPKLDDPTGEPELDDGFAVLRELLAAEEHAPPAADDDDEYDDVVPMADVEVLQEELEAVQAELRRTVEALQEEAELATSLHEQLEGAVEEARAWETEAIALRAELDDAQAEAESLRKQLDAVHAALEEQLYDGPERRTGGPDLRSEFDQLSQGERRRGLRPRDGERRRPLRARKDDEAQVEPETAAADDDDIDYDQSDHHDFDSRELVMSGWSDRLRDVAASGVTWTADDTDRLRANEKKR